MTLLPHRSGGRLVGESALAAAAILLLLTSGGCRIIDSDHCNHLRDEQGRGGDAWCVANQSLRYCDLCQVSAEDRGCTDVMPEAFSNELEMVFE